MRRIVLINFRRNFLTTLKYMQSIEKNLRMIQVETWLKRWSNEAEKKRTVFNSFQNLENQTWMN